MLRQEATKRRKVKDPWRAWNSEQKTNAILCTLAPDSDPNPWPGRFDGYGDG